MKLPAWIAVLVLLPLTACQRPAQPVSNPHTVAAVGRITQIAEIDSCRISKLETEGRTLYVASATGYAACALIGPEETSPGGLDNPGR